MENITPFITNNLVFILAIISAFITFLIFVVEKLVVKQKVKLLLIFTALGLLAIVGKEIIGLQEKKNKTLLEVKKKEIIDEILKKTTRTLSFVKSLSNKLNGSTLEKIGVELVQPETNQHLLQFSKGNSETWQKYAKWLENFKNLTNKTPCLSFTVGKEYNANLILAYIFTNNVTRNTIAEVIKNEWWKFPNKQFIKNFDPPRIDIKYVLFYKVNSSPTLIGYADANLFANELLRYMKMEKQNKVEEILNGSSTMFEEEMKKYFKSFKSNVKEVKDAITAAKMMLSESIDELAVVHKGKVYLVRLSKIVKLVN